MAVLNPPPTIEQVRSGRIINNCLICGERVFTVYFTSFPSSQPLGPKYPRCGSQTAYCPACDIFLDAWIRVELKSEDANEALSAFAVKEKPDGPIEAAYRVWRWNSQRTALESADSLFEYSVPSARATKNITATVTEHRSLLRYLRWRRELSGPRFRDDEKRFTISIPKQAIVGPVAKLVQSVSKGLKSGQGGALVGQEDTNEEVQLHFNRRDKSMDVAFKLRDRGLLPPSSTMWAYNDGRRYEFKQWDWARGTEAVPAQREREIPKKTSIRPKRKRPARDSATLAAILERLMHRMARIEEDCCELTDTHVREQTFAAIYDGFIEPREGSEIPSTFGMCERQSDLRVHRAIKAFVTAARRIADVDGLTPQQRLDFLQQPEFSADDFFGYSETLDTARTVANEVWNGRQTAKGLRKTQ